MGIQKQIVQARFYPLVIIDRRILDLLYSSEVLNFSMQAQTQTQWCWAATSTSVSHFYSFLSPWTQCKVAKQAQSLECCDTPLPTGCNVSWYLNQALAITENFVSYQSGTIPWSQIKDELDKGLVVGARIGWNGGGGHFMVIHGVSRILFTEYLHIDDPIYGKSTLTYDQFATNYQGSGSWTHTYFTKKKFYFMWYREILVQAKLLEPIYKVRPLLDVHGLATDLQRTVPDAALSVPHYNYVLRLDQIGRRTTLPSAATSLRVLEVDQEKAVAMYEVGVDADNPQLLQVNSDERLFAAIDASLEVLEKEAVRVKATPELRSLKIPALNLEALWLHYTGATEDRFKLLRGFATPGFDAGRVYREKEFLALLATAAQAARKMDDEMGA